MKRKMMVLLCSVLLLCALTAACTPKDNGYEVTLDQVELTLEAGTTVTLTPTVGKEGVTLEWSSSDESVATVKDGAVTGLKEGSAVIKATAEGKYSAECNVTVQNTIARSVVLDETEISLPVGEHYTLHPTLKEGTKTIDGLKWSFSSEFSYVKVSEDGVIEAVLETGDNGASSILVSTTYLGKTYSEVVYVTVVSAIEFTLSDDEIELALVEGYDLKTTATVTWTYRKNGESVTDKTVEWTSEEDTIASVAGGGVITAHALGETTITATVEGEEGLFASVTVRVVRPVVDLTATESFTVDVNEDETWELKLQTEGYADEAITEISDGEKVVSQLRDKKVLLTETFVSGKNAGESGELYLNTDTLSYKVSVDYMQTYYALPAENFVPDGLYKDQVSWTKQTEKQQKRYGTYKYHSDPISKNASYFDQKVLLRGLGDFYKQGRYLAFDFYIEPAAEGQEDPIDLVFATKAGKNEYNMRLDLSKGTQGTGDASHVYYDGTQSVLVLNSSGNINLKTGAWLTVIVDLDHIYGGEESDILVLTFNEGWATGGKDTDGVDAYFDRIRLYDEGQYAKYLGGLESNGKSAPKTYLLTEPASVNLKPNGTAELSARLTKALLDLDAAVTWETGDASIATVEGSTVTAVKDGVTELTAKSSYETQEYTATVSVFVSANGTIFDIGTLTVRDAKHGKLAKAESEVGGRKGVYTFSYLESDWAYDAWHNGTIVWLDGMASAIAGKRYVAIDFYVPKQINRIRVGSTGAAGDASLSWPMSSPVAGYAFKDSEGNAASAVTAGAWYTLIVDLDKIGADGGRATGLSISFHYSDNDPEHPEAGTAVDVASIDHIVFYTEAEFNEAYPPQA